MEQSKRQILTPEQRRANQKAYQKEWYKQNRERLLTKYKEYYHEDEGAYRKYKNFYDKWHGVIEQLSAQLQAH